MTCQWYFVVTASNGLFGLVTQLDWECWVWIPKADEWVSHPSPPPTESNSIPASWGNGGLHSCILKKRYRDIDLPQGWWAKCSQDCFLPPINVLTKPVHLRKPLKCKANEKTPQPRVKTSTKTPAFTWQKVISFRAPRQYLSCSLSFLSNKSYFLYWLWLISQLPHEPVLWSVKARTLDTVLQHLSPACNIISFWDLLQSAHWGPGRQCGPCRAALPKGKETGHLLLQL
jgi:hypothetical protein